ncbi:ArnT family glycosyltransferase [Chloroflexota bacterium]
MSYKEIFRLSHRESIFCCLVFLLGLLTISLGLIVSSDSVMYINVGENIYSGNGFVFGYGDDIVAFKHQPLYPVLIAVGMYLGFTVEQAAGIIPSASLALLMFPLFFLGKFLSRTLTGYMACIICLLSAYLLKVATFAWTDMPYLFLSSVVIMFLAIYWRYNKISPLIFAGLFAALTVLTKYAGIILIVIGAVIIVVNNRHNFKRLVIQSVAYGLISGLPLALWLWTNQSLGYTIGTNMRMGGLSTTISLAINSLIFDIFSIPLRPVLERGMPVIIIVLVVLLTVLAVIFIKKETLLTYLRINFPIVTYIFIYAGVLALVTSSLWEGVVGGVMDARKVFVLFPFIIILIISTSVFIYDRLKQTKMKLNVKRLLITCFIIFTLVQAYHAGAFINSSRSPGFGGFNSLVWENDPAIFWLRDNDRLMDAAIYTDRKAPLLFQLKRSIKELPISDKMQIEKLFEELRNKGSGDAYICVYLRDSHRQDFTSNGDILDYNSKYNILVKAVEFPNAIIYKTK